MTSDPGFVEIAGVYRDLARKLAAIDDPADRRIALDTVRDRLDRDRQTLAGPPSHGIVADSFALETLIARSQHFETWRARQRDLGTLHALKTVAQGRGSDPVLRTMLLREAALHISIRYPGVVSAQALLRLPDGRPGLLMEFVTAPTLNDIVANGRLPGNGALRLASRLCASLAAVHASGVVHLDVAPGNILVPDGDVASCVLADFGLARRVGEATSDNLLAAAGTPGFSDNQRAIADPAADYRALASILAAVLTDNPADPDRPQVLQTISALADGRPCRTGDQFIDS